MQIKFKTEEAYKAAYTYLHGNNYKFIAYKAINEMRFYFPYCFRIALEALEGIGITADAYTHKETENVLPKLVNSWSV